MAQSTAKTTEEKKVKIRLPRETNGQQYQFVGVNGKTYQLQRGVEVEVPESVAEILLASEAMKEEAYARREALMSSQNG